MTRRRDDKKRKACALQNQGRYYQNDEMLCSVLFNQNRPQYLRTPLLLTLVIITMLIPTFCGHLLEFWVAIKIQESLAGRRKIAFVDDAQ